MNPFQEIQKKWPNLVQLNYSLREHTYLQTGGIAAVWLTLASQEALEEVMNYLIKKKIDYEIMGRGTNVIVKEGLIDKVILNLKLPNRATVDGDEIEIPCSCLLIRACKLAHDHFLSGLEFFVGIPGSVGGAVVMNAGVKNQEVRNVLKEVVMFREGRIQRVDASALDLSYRHSNIQKNEIILFARFKLNRISSERLAIEKDKCLQELLKRKNSQPYQDPSVGSTFMNPLPHYAGNLIERCGLKGERIGGMSISTKHANFIVNDGTGTSDEALKLIQLIKEKVKEKESIELKEEVKFLGF